VTGVKEILTELSRRGVAIQAEGQNLRLRPKSAVDEKLLARVREHKPELLAMLSARPSTPLQAAQAPPCGSKDCAGCYDLEPGRRVHPPKPSQEWLEWLARWQKPKGQRVQ
jgi:tubulysin polyketide synthase-like protein